MSGDAPEMPANALRKVRGPGDYDWTGRRCTFLVRTEGGRPVLDAGGRLEPGETKARGTVLGQTYLGLAEDSLIPNYEVRVETKTGRWRILLLENNFQVVG